MSDGERQERPGSDEPDPGPEVATAELVDPDPADPVDQAVPVDPVDPSDPDFSESGVPSFDYVRDRIESRYTTALGATELADESAVGRSVEEQFEERERAGKDRLEELRRSLRDEPTT